MDRGLALDMLIVLVSFVGAISLLVKGGASTIIVGKGVEFVGLAIIGIMLAARYPDEVHAIARTGSYLPQGHTQRYEVTYVSGSSRAKTRDLGLIVGGVGITLIVVGVFIGASGWMWNLASGIFFVVSMLMSARHPIKRLLLVTWSVSQIVFIGFVGGPLYLVFGFTGVAFAIITVHAFIGLLLALPRTERMLERAAEVSMTRP